MTFLLIFVMIETENLLRLNLLFQFSCSLIISWLFVEENNVIDKKNNRACLKNVYFDSIIYNRPVYYTETKIQKIIIEGFILLKIYYK